MTAMETLAKLVEDGLNGHLRVTSGSHRWTIHVAVTTRNGRTSVDLEAFHRTSEGAAKMILTGLDALGIRPGGRYLDGRWYNEGEDPDMPPDPRA